MMVAGDLMTIEWHGIASRITDDDRVAQDSSQKN